MKSVRVFYKKNGNMKFISHLDMNRYMSRLLSMSNIPLWHTEGFNQHAYLTFALPLSLGMSSDYDIMDIKLTDDEYSNQDVVSNLNKLAVDGIEVFAADQPKMKVANLTYAEYILTVKDNVETLNNLQKFLNHNHIIATKKGKKGKISEIDVASKIVSKSIELNQDELIFKVTLPAGSTENINPMLFISAYEEFFEYKLSVVKCCRTMLYNSDMERFC